MTNPRSGEVWLVKFHPQFGAELQRYRPAVILSDLIEIDTRFCLVVPLTTDTVIRHQTEVPVTADFLDQPSLVLSWYQLTLDRHRLQARLGTLPEQTFFEIHDQAIAALADQAA